MASPKSAGCTSLGSQIPMHQVELKLNTQHHPTGSMGTCSRQAPHNGLLKGLGNCMGGHIMLSWKCI